MKISFVGAGPGDPELITVKGQRLLAEADVIVYAGSLVNPALLQLARAGAKIYNSATMDLPEIIRVMVEAYRQEQKVVRLHTGDPSIYGAINEQMDLLDQAGIGYEVIPGVSSFLAAAAALRREYTVPEKSQTVIITRAAGRTPVPEQESLAELARHRTAMCIFLSTHLIEEVVAELRQGYREETPVAVVEKASWPEERIIRGTLGDIAARVREAGINRTALILIGPFLSDQHTRSLLYDTMFSHGYRQAPGDGS